MTGHQTTVGVEFFQSNPASLLNFIALQPSAAFLRGRDLGTVAL